MGAGEFFEPTFRAYVGYYVGFCIRYFAVAGGIYWFFHVAFPRQWLAYRIQRDFPARDDILNTIRWSMLNTACTGLSTLWLYQLIRDGRTKMYFAVADYGWLYLGLSVVVALVSYDTWFYWHHRLLHTPWLFRHVHAVHHRASNPTAFAAFAHHPIETFMGNAYFIVFLTVVPIHPMAIGAAGLCIFMVAMIAHMGYEFYPRGFTRHRLFRGFDTSTHHNMHHRHVGCNYSILFNYWDRLMRTNHPAYHDTFDAIKTRLKAGSGVRPVAQGTHAGRRATAVDLVPEIAGGRQG